MKPISFLILFTLLSLNAACGESSPTPAQTLSWAALSAMPLPEPGERIPYGDGPQQFGELRLPKGEGPFSVIVLIHGGCWQSAFDFAYITRLAAWLTERGVATWTIEYRRLGDEDGGWPGTFLDAANATDALREIAEKAPIDLERVYAAGHSAGGHLALWLATRAKLPDSSELFRKDPVTIRGVLGLAAIANLATYRVGPPGSCHSSVDQLLGGTPDTVPDRYAQTSPQERLPLGVPQIFIQGEVDPIVDPASVRDYAAAAEKAGDKVTILPLPGAGHFEASVPLPQTEATFEKALRLLLNPAS